MLASQTKKRECQVDSLINVTLALIGVELTRFSINSSLTFTDKYNFMAHKAEI